MAKNENPLQVFHRRSKNYTFCSAGRGKRFGFFYKKPLQKKSLFWEKVLILFTKVLILFTKVLILFPEKVQPLQALQALQALDLKDAGAKFMEQAFRGCAAGMGASAALSLFNSRQITVSADAYLSAVSAMLLKVNLQKRAYGLLLNFERGKWQNN